VTGLPRGAVRTEQRMMGTGANPDACGWMNDGSAPLRRTPEKAARRGRLEFRLRVFHVIPSDQMWPAWRPVARP
jgi:hypothetical protein